MIEITTEQADILRRLNHAARPLHEAIDRLYDLALMMVPASKADEAEVSRLCEQLICNAQYSTVETACEEAGIVVEASWFREGEL